MEAVQEAMFGLGVDTKDVKAVNEIISPSKRLPQKARVIKMNAFDTIVNIQEKWKKHKEKSAELLQQAKKRDLSHRERYANLQKKLSSTELENDRLKQDLRRLEELCTELQTIKKQEGLYKKERDEAALEERKAKELLKTQQKRISELKAKSQVLENDKAKVERDNGELRLAFRKAENQNIILEKDLRETKVELEMFEEMLRDLRVGDSTMNIHSDLSDEVLSPPKENFLPPVISEDLMPIFNSTPLVKPMRPKSKLADKHPSLTTGLNQLAEDHAKKQALCDKLAKQAAEMKERDIELTKLLNETP